MFGLLQHTQNLKLEVILNTPNLIELSSQLDSLYEAALYQRKVNRYLTQGHIRWDIIPF